MPVPDPVAEVELPGGDPWRAVDDARRARAADAVAGVVRRTPVLSSRGLSERFGAPIALKAENLQRTGSFKLRGALARVAALADDAAGGVVAGSAGNHAQAVAYAARERGVPCDVFMPEEAPIAKVEACLALGARVHREGASVLEAIAAANALARDGGRSPVHPFDDADVIAGQATIGAELLEQVPELAQVVVPLGGGGLASGIALAVKAHRPRLRVVGVQAAAVAPFHRGRHGGGAPAPGTPAAGADYGLVGQLRAPTIADGIAVKRPGALTRPLVEALLDDVVVVSEDQIAEAMVVLLERAKLLVEGAGAVSLAAALCGRVVRPASGTTVLVLSGGNVDPGLVANVVRRHESVVGRRLVVLTVVPDRPGALGRLLTEVGATGPISSRFSTSTRGLSCTYVSRPSSSCSRPGASNTPAGFAGRSRPRGTTSVAGPELYAYYHTCMYCVCNTNARLVSCCSDRFRSRLRSRPPR